MAQRKKSADEHRANGTFRKDRHDPEPAAGNLLTKLPASPFPLAPGAQAIYKKEGENLIYSKTLKPTDLQTLAQYASEANIYIRCMEQVNAGALVVELHNGVTTGNQHRKMAETALKNMLALADRLGMSPRSRHAMRGQSAFADEKNEEIDPMLSLHDN